MKISAYAASVVAALCLALAGCSSEDEPGGSSPTTKPTATVTSDAPPAPPELPAAATKKTAAGAEAFVKYYWAVVDYGEKHGTTDELRAINLDGCEACGNGIDAMEAAFAEGATFRMPPTVVRATSSTIEQKGDVTLANVFIEVISRAGTKYFGPGDKRNRPQAASRSLYVASCGWSPRDRTWRILALTSYEQR